MCSTQVVIKIGLRLMWLLEYEARAIGARRVCGVRLGARKQQCRLALLRHMLYCKHLLRTYMQFAYKSAYLFCFISIVHSLLIKLQNYALL